MAVKKSPPPARDTDKMVRQLSLVAYLMAHKGRRVDATTIRWRVEGYGDDQQSWDAFTRAFHRDREELARLGIEIRHQRDDFSDAEVYWLPPENYFLPPVDFSREELAALNACLCLLEGQFAYSRLLRLALQGLALGSGIPLDDPVTDCFSVNLLSSGFDGELAARQKEIETAISRRKTVIFDYYTPSRDAVEERIVDPYAILLTRGDWYLIGYSHERRDVRIFKISRIQGRIRAQSKKEHNFDLPEDFRVKDYLNLEPWQLGPIKGEAEIFFSPRRGWWAKSNLAGSGSVELREDGSAVLRTAYSDAAPLCSLVLGLRQDARILAPPELRAEMVSFLRKIISAHEGKPQKQKIIERQKAARGGVAGRSSDHTQAGGATSAALSAAPSDGPQVPPERFSQMAKTIAYLLERLSGEEKVILPAAEVSRDLGFENIKTLEQAIDLLRLVNVGAGGYLVEAYLKSGNVHAATGLEADLLKRPAHLSPREARALLIAIDLVGSHILGGRYESLTTAREKILKATGGLDESQTIAVGETEKEDFNICRVINKGLTEHRLVEIEYLSQRAERPAARRIEPYLLNRVKGQWYLHAWCRERVEMRTFRFEMIKSAALLKEEFEPRPPEETDLDRYLRDPRLPSGKEAPHVAEVLFSPGLAPWVRERQDDVRELKDGSLIVRIPYFDSNWIVEEVLKHRGQAVLIYPEELRGQIVSSAADLAGEYGPS